MPNTVLVRFARKPINIEEVRGIKDNPYYETSECIIIETKQMSGEEYDAFGSYLLDDNDWLSGKGGATNNFRHVIAVTAPERETLYIDPSGHSYARYVGMRVPAVGA